MENKRNVWKSIDTINREMGEVKTSISFIQRDVTYLKKNTAKKRDIGWLKTAIGVNTALIVSLIGLLIWVAVAI